MKYKIVIDIMNEKMTNIGENEKQSFIRGYKKMLKDGFYLARHKEDKQWFTSNKNIEKLSKQIINQDEFIKNIFIQI